MEIESKVASHCVTHACSEANSLFGTPCKEHTDTCAYCEGIPILIQSIRGAIDKAAYGGLGVEEHEDLVFKLNAAHKSIYSYKLHLLRAYCQNYFWDLAKSTEDDTIAFMVQDWAMKWLGEVLRESQLDWFGKTGMI